MSPQLGMIMKISSLYKLKLVFWALLPITIMANVDLAAMESRIKAL